jgi:hypothetical protein
MFAGSRIITMDMDKFRAWIYDRQGLAGGRYRTAREALAGAGWQRSVGGVSPYLAIRARSREGRAEVDALAADLQLFELPTARGCTYVLPAEHFALGLSAGRGFGSATEIATARRLGVEDAEVERLKSAVPEALAGGPLSPADLKTKLGDKVRNLGEEGKKRGLTTTLPLALGLLQMEGRIRRKPTNGRLDTQKYDYELWDPPVAGIPDEATAGKQLAELFFRWTGAATLKDFRTFSAFTVKRAQLACDQAGIIAFGSEPGLLCLPGSREEFEAFDMPSKPAYSLVGNLDSFLHYRRTGTFWLHEEDKGRMVPTDKGVAASSELMELWSHAILDRGRLIGLWEYDGENGEIVWSTWLPADNELREKVADTERYIREELGDARSFSLDSPVSRRPRLEVLRGMVIA